MFRSASLFIGTSVTVAVFTIFATSNVDAIVGIPHKIYSMQRILIHIKSQSLCYMCPSAPRVCSESGGQKLVLSLSLDRIKGMDFFVLIKRFISQRTNMFYFMYFFIMALIHVFIIQHATTPTTDVHSSIIKDALNTLSCKVTQPWYSVMKL